MNNWNDYLIQYEDEFWSFIDNFYSHSVRKCIIIGGAGFDPRSWKLIKDLASKLDSKLSVYVIKEERPSPTSDLVKKAESNLELIKQCCNSVQVLNIKIFADDQAVVGGRRLVTELKKVVFDENADIFIDVSALSIGISFPLVNYFFMNAKEHKRKINIHLIVNSNPELDSLIQPSPNDSATEAHGFNIKNLFGDDQPAIMWLPQLVENHKSILSLIYSKVRPHDTCPILPFPSSDDLKKGDSIVVGLMQQLESEWGVDMKNLIYADERKPLDIYRTILRIKAEREPVFRNVGGSQIILSPLGSKITAIGALIAALEEKLPIIYVEALNYSIIDWLKAEKLAETANKLVHIWLYGEAYARDI